MPNLISPPVFAQSLDAQRPHTLLTANPMRSGSLAYRYDDTQETVTVPHVWYNETYQARVAHVLWDAQTAENAAANIERNPPLNLSPAAVAAIAGRYRARAERIRAEARRMEAAGQVSHPAFAARLPLDYGANA